MALSNAKVGDVAVDGSGNRWRVTEEMTSKIGGGFKGRAVIDGRVVTKDLGTVGGIASVEEATVETPGAEISIGGIPGEILTVHEGEHGHVYAVRIHRDVQPFGSQQDDVRQVHFWGIDP